MHDKNGSAIAFVVVMPGPSFRPTRMDRLTNKMKDDADQGHYPMERILVGNREWAIKLAKPQEKEDRSFRPKFR